VIFQSFLHVHLLFQCIDKVVRRPGTAKEQLEGWVPRKVARGAAKGFHRIAGHAEVEGEETTSPGRREFHFVLNEAAAQRIAEIRYQGVLSLRRPISANPASWWRSSPLAL